VRNDHLNVPMLSSAEFFGFASRLPQFDATTVSTLPSKSSRAPRLLVVLLVAALAVSLPTLLSAQGNTTFQNFYDDVGRLAAVVDSAGNVVRYQYDDSGNIVAITRSTLPSTSTLAIFSVAPLEGPVGTHVLIQGQGFSSTPANDVVMFNGVAATATSTTANQLKVTVPATATTGPLTLTVGGVTVQCGTFTVLRELTSIAVIPANFSLVLGNKQQFTATGTFTDGSTQGLTASANWLSSSTTVATMVNSPNSITNGLATGVALGSTTITATSGSISGSTSLTVIPGALVSIAVTPANPSILAGGTFQLFATGTYISGVHQDVTNSVTWNSSNTGVATISNSPGTQGLATGVTAGTTTIAATSGTVSGNTILTVNASSTGPVPRFAYLMNCDTVSIFTVSPKTGLFRANGFVSTGPQCGAADEAIDPFGRFLYISSTNNAGTAAAIVGFGVNATTGALTPIPGSPFTAPNGGKLLVNPSGSFVYQVGPDQTTSATEIFAFSIDAGTGALIPVTGSPFSPASATQPFAMGIDSSGKFAYVANTGTNNISVLAINGTGALAEIAGSPFAAPSVSSISALVADPAGNFLYVTDEGSGAVSAFAINPTTGALAPVSGSPFSAGLPGRYTSIAMDAAGKFLYRGGPRVSGFTVNATTGALTPISGFPLISPTGGGQLVTVDPSGSFLYVTGGSSEFSVYNINPTSGALTLAGTPRTRSGPTILALTKGTAAVTYTPKSAYVANSSDSDLSASIINSTTGALTAITGSPFLAGTNPASVATDLLGRFAYAANQGSNNLSAYSIDATSGALTAVGGSPFAAGTNPVSVVVDPSSRFVYAANQGSNNISAYTVDSAGALTAITGSPFASGMASGSLASDPLGEFVYVANHGSNNISAYLIAGASGPQFCSGASPPAGGLCPLTGSPFAAGTGPVAVAVDPLDRFVYVVNATSGNVSGYSICCSSNTLVGSMTPVPGSPFAAGTNPKSVVVEPTGRFAYVAGGPPGSPGFVSAFSIDTTSGALTPISSSPFAVGTNPASLTVDISGQFVYVANSGSNNVSILKIDPTTGALTAIAGSPFAAGTTPKAITTTGTIQ
jgi:6-phosphogluconolactonase